jgi:hypothetical protein
MDGGGDGLREGGTGSKRHSYAERERGTDFLAELH